MYPYDPIDSDTGQFVGIFTDRDKGLVDNRLTVGELYKAMEDV